MMNRVITGMAGFLSAAPDPLLDVTRLSGRLPGTPSDMPAVAMSVAVDTTRGTGLGAFRKEGSVLVQNNDIADIEISPTGFSADLKTLQLGAMVRKPADVQVVRVTGADQPVTYRMVSRPATAEEFQVDATSSRLIFGAAQPAGGKLQVTYSSMDFRNDITGGRCQGVIFLELWTGNASDVSALSDKLQNKLAGGESGLRQSGFALLAPATLDAAENFSYQPASGSGFAVWKQKLSYRFHFDLEQGGDASSGGPIRKISVQMDDAVAESFATPTGS